MVVKSNKPILILTVAAIFIFCYFILGKNKSVHHPFNKFSSFNNCIVEIASRENYEIITDSFTLLKDDSIRIFAVGELIYNFCYSRQDLYFKGDDVQLEFASPNREPGFRHKQYFSWSDAIGRKGNYKQQQDQFSYVGRYCDSTNFSGYELIVTFPLSFIYDSLKSEVFKFNITVGDNDDGFAQKAKLSLITQSEFRDSGPNFILTNGETSIKLENEIKSYYSANPLRSIQVDSLRFKHVELEAIDFGVIRNKNDLSCSLKAAHDRDSMVFLIRISDANRKRVWYDQIKNAQTLSDFAIIKDKNDSIVWQMHALNTRHAGGAQKNHFIDTVVKLKSGTYWVTYLSDESHSPSAWDAAPPEILFRGIRIYK